MNENENGSALAMTAPEVPPSMKAAIERAETAIAEQHRIEQALETAREGLRQAEVELAEARRTLAVAEASVAIGDGDVDKNARKRLLAARDESEFVRARVAGLEERLRRATATANEARLTLAVEYRNWTRGQAGTYVEQVYKPALHGLLDAMRVLSAAGTALGVNRLLAIPSQAVVADPDDPMRNLANPRRSPWRNDPEAVAVYERLSALIAVIRPLLGEFADGPIPQAPEDSDAAA